jgi:hypothetical protein
VLLLALRGGFRWSHVYSAARQSRGAELDIITATRQRVPDAVPLPVIRVRTIRRCGVDSAIWKVFTSPSRGSVADQSDRGIDERDVELSDQLLCV